MSLKANVCLEEEVPECRIEGGTYEIDLKYLHGLASRWCSGVLAPGPCVCHGLLLDKKPHNQAGRPSLRICYRRKGRGLFDRLANREDTPSPHFHSLCWGHGTLGVPF